MVNPTYSIVYVGVISLSLHLPLASLPPSFFPLPHSSILHPPFPSLNILTTHPRRHKQHVTYINMCLCINGSSTISILSNPALYGYQGSTTAGVGVRFSPSGSCERRLCDMGIGDISRMDRARSGDWCPACRSVEWPSLLASPDFSDKVKTKRGHYIHHRPARPMVAVGR